MRFFSLILVLLLGATGALAKQVELDNGNVTVEIPDDFTALTEDEIAKKFPRQNNNAIEAYGNETREVNIVFSITKIATKPEDIPPMKDTTMAGYEKTFKVQPIKNDLVEIHGTQWIYLEMTGQVEGQGMHNIQITTSYRGVMLCMSYNSSAQLFDADEGELRASVNSVTIKPGAAKLQPLPTDRPLTAEEEVQRGRMAIRDGNIDGAEEAFKNALSVNPKLASAHIGLGMVNSDKGFFDVAIQNFSEALADDPNSAEAMIDRARAELDACDLEAASADVKSAMNRMPDNPMVYGMRAFIEGKSGDYEKARSDFNQALSLHAGDAAALNGRGWLSLVQGHLDQAREDFKLASASRVNDPGNFYNLAILDMLEGKRENALKALQSVTVLAAHRRGAGLAHLFIWVIEAGRNKNGDANEQLAGYLKDDSQLKNEWVENVGAFLLGQMSEEDLVASADSDNPLKKEIQLCRVWYFIGIKHQVAGEKAEAAKAFRKCLGTDQKFLEYYLLANAELSPGEGDSKLGLSGGMGDSPGFATLLILGVMGVIALVGIGTAVVLIFLLASGSKTPVAAGSPRGAPRSVTRVPPMK